MFGKNIATIYFYLISAASLALIIVGIFNIVNFIINSTQYEKYPLRFGQVMDCGNVPAPAIYKITPPDGFSTPSAQELQNQKQQCEAQLELQRKQYRLDDIKNAITFTLVGIILFSIHFPLARKQSSQ